MRCPTCGARQGMGRHLPALQERPAAAPRRARDVRGAPPRPPCSTSTPADLEAALHHARRCHELRPGPESHRLLAVCQLLRGDWAERPAARAAKACGRATRPGPRRFSSTRHPQRSTPVDGSRRGLAWSEPRAIRCAKSHQSRGELASWPPCSSSKGPTRGSGSSSPPVPWPWAGTTRTPCSSTITRCPAATPSCRLDPGG